jgi:hypothetical protein
LEATCHCGAVRFEVARAPVNVYDCNCSICRRLGTLWAYYSPDDVRFDSGPDATFAYLWGDRRIEFHTCRACGCTTHWQAAAHPDAARKMGVNARLMDELDRSAVYVRQLDCAETGVFWPPATLEAHDPE